MSTTPKLRAVFIGINYKKCPSNRLAGCANDVKNMMSRVCERDFKTIILSDDINQNNVKWPSRKNIIDALAWVTKDMKAGDEAFVHYSGHGGLTLDLSGDELSGKDSCLFPISDDSIIECITDDELRKLLVDRVPQGAKCTVVFDCCHSGSCLDLRYGYKPLSETQIIISENPRYAKGKGLVVFISGCDDTQTAADTVDSKNVPTGALSNALLEVLKKETKMKKLLWGILKELKTKGYSQIPQLSSSIPFQLSDPFIC
jgi:uncharacterized caspase-like protein